MGTRRGSGGVVLGGGEEGCARPEGITKGCAHAPLMVQEGLGFLSGYPHIYHLPAQLCFTHDHLHMQVQLNYRDQVASIEYNTC